MDDYVWLANIYTNKEGMKYELQETLEFETEDLMTNFCFTFNNDSHFRPNMYKNKRSYAVMAGKRQKPLADLKKLIEEVEAINETN